MGKRRKGLPVHGWVFLDKPLGLGSTQAVSMVRRAFNAQKAGHAGTLDPLATGLLGSFPLYTLLGISTCPVKRRDLGEEPQPEEF